MHYTIELLIQGNQQIIVYYNKAKEKWNEILKEYDINNIDEFSKKLNISQLWFEHNCGGRWVGQEIMVVSGICQFYTTQNGFGESKKSAIRIYKAFMMSYCSIEVKGIADEIAKSYYLLEDE
jgi:hypothetical protein